jgi:hypothetical protein
MVPTAKFKSKVGKQKRWGMRGNGRHVKMEDETMENGKDDRILYMR